MQERDNILRILEETKGAIEKGDSVRIKNLSNQTINTASLTQDLDNVAVAVMVYSLSKILEREDYKRLKGWSLFYKNFLVSIDKAIADLRNGDEEKLREDFERINKSIRRLSGKLKKYVEEIFRRSKINKASRIHEHGISLERTARLLGISLYELSDYVGKTGISDVPESRTLNAKSRIKLAEDFFG
jgi:predicted HTH domain antitoxin